jgi:hypothetical protein
MSRRLAFRLKAIDAVSLDDSGDSQVIRISEVDKACIHIKASGTVLATVTYSISVRSAGPDSKNPSPWLVLDLGGTPTLSPSNDEILINLDKLTFDELKISYTSDENQGDAVTATAYFVAKTVGA